MGQILENLSDLVRRRKRLGLLKQKDLAGVLGISPSHVSQVLAGKRSLSEDLLLKFCDALEISPGELVRSSPYSNPEHQALHDRLQALLEMGMEAQVSAAVKLVESLTDR